MSNLKPQLGHPALGLAWARNAPQARRSTVRVEAVEEPVMREIRYLDKLIYELAKGRKMEKILRT